MTLTIIKQGTRNCVVRWKEKVVVHMFKKKREKGLEKGISAISAGELKKYFLAHWQLYLMMLPPLIILLIFSYGPMYGLILAFKDYKVSLGIGEALGQVILDGEILFVSSIITIFGHV